MIHNIIQLPRASMTSSTRKYWKHCATSPSYVGTIHRQRRSNTCNFRENDYKSKALFITLAGLVLKCLLNSTASRLLNLRHTNRPSSIDNFFAGIIKDDENFEQDSHSWFAWSLNLKHPASQIFCVKIDHWWQKNVEITFATYHTKTVLTILWQTIVFGAQLESRQSFEEVN